MPGREGRSEGRGRRSLWVEIARPRDHLPVHLKAGARQQGRKGASEGGGATDDKGFHLVTLLLGRRLSYFAQRNFFLTPRRYT